ncbi:hypothetical protein FAM09_23875 [Niastella caeni]|uniref:Uncharacterized protein n=1 Tax=Niastella caeni TaxID=2569763 RepID=A0A4S8HGG0_9BACT|nr:hypothetical protein [Niastella caeni]THU34063.1 hypothetical protein FAM09_23875 [Niastella caeni]
MEKKPFSLRCLFAPLRRVFVLPLILTCCFKTAIIRVQSVTVHGVVGYDTQRKKDVTGAISSVSEKHIEERQSYSSGVQMG